VLRLSSLSLPSCLPALTSVVGFKSLAIAGRYLIHQGSVLLRMGEDELPKPRMLFLFNDLLLFTWQKHVDKEKRSLAMKESFELKFCQIETKVAECADALSASTEEQRDERDLLFALVENYVDNQFQTSKKVLCWCVTDSECVL
jgi:hypothetical protein